MTDTAHSIHSDLSSQVDSFNLDEISFSRVECDQNLLTNSLAFVSFLVISQGNGQ